MPRQVLRQRFRTAGDGEHAGAGGQGVQELGAGGDHVGRDVEGEDTGEVGGGEFADRMPDEVIGPDAPRPQ